MIDHLSTYASNYPLTKAFYDAAFAALGLSVQMELVTEWDAAFPTRRMCAYGPIGKPVFWVIESHEPSTPRHVAFSAGSRAQVEAFHAAGLAAGGEDNGKPGLRPHYHADYYGAFLLDPDGNNVEAVCHSPV
ncbi:VOC family protein [Pokkaliibacter sp. MBI-7]|uniref:VOC family protein n=1 Tax=Pokkaliibacter sp. MBI-7 TaxID=3040600 RepID=UPI0024488DFA|nr:VOC family protein [Pokkaliibacter sp. MBI-7]MDH2432591.1 VOC family protein [Pokkaliibacter sp. MBI-7]